MNMLRCLVVLAIVATPLRAEDKDVAVARETANVVLAVHGGLGIERSELTPELEKEYRAKLTEALRAGYDALKHQKTPALDAVEAAIRVLEDSPLFNAGKGAVFTSDGRNELDAAIMEGDEHRGGAVANVTIIKNPISAARAVMQDSEHVLLVGRGAEVFATSVGVEIVDPSYFWTERRWNELKKAWNKESAKLEESAESRQPDHDRKYWGTVGAVAVDRYGLLVAGTSTGGMTNKRFGRVGGVPILGAGTYADNDSCAVSGTGHGEFFIRFVIGHEISARMKFGGLSVGKAADKVIHETLKAAGGEAGVIALDAKGSLAMPYNSAGMPRGYITRDGQTQVMLFAD
jgi:beta-aspartyl-peptidase (threonine type)